MFDVFFFTTDGYRVNGLRVTKLSSVFRFRLWQSAAGCGYLGLAARADALSSLRSQRVACYARAERLAARVFFISHRNHGNHRKLLAARVNGLASLVGGVVRSAGKERVFLLRC